MKKYKVESISVTINSGKICITKNQAARRSHALKHLDGNVYEVLSPVDFKRDEEFGFDGSINKALMVELGAASSRVDVKEDSDQGNDELAKKRKKAAESKAKSRAKKKAKKEKEENAKKEKEENAKKETAEK